MPPAAAPLPTTVRMPGRHASRRTTRVWSLGVPETRPRPRRPGPGAARGRGRARRGRPGPHLLVVGAQRRSRGGGAHRPDDAARRAGDAAGSNGATEAAAAPPSGAPAKVVVDVTGKVRRPGIAVLRQGARVIDALRAAGGARPGVDLGGLNLARVLTDGEQVVVGQAVAPGPVALRCRERFPGRRAGQHQHRRRDCAGVAARGRAGHGSGDHDLPEPSTAASRRSTSSSMSTASATPPWPS